MDIFIAMLLGLVISVCSITTGVIIGKIICYIFDF